MATLAPVTAASAQLAPTPDATGTITLGGPLRVTPAPEATVFTRCGSLGNDSDWRPHLSPDGQRLAVLTNAGTVHLVDVARGAEIAELASHHATLDAATFSPDGRLLATYSHVLGQADVWDAQDGSHLRTVQATRYAGFVGAIAFSLDGRYLQVADSVRYDLHTGDVTPSALPSLPGELTALAGGEWLLSHHLTRAGSSPITDVVSMVRAGSAREVPSINLFYGWQDGFGGYAASADGTQIAVADSAGRISAYVPGVAAPRAESVRLGSALALAYSVDGARLHVRTRDGVVTLASHDLHEEARFSLAPDATFLGASPGGALTVSDARTTTWLDPLTGAVRRTLDDRLAHPVWSRDGAVVAAAGTNALVHVLQELDGAALWRAPPRGVVPSLGDASLDQRGLRYDEATLDGRLAASADARIEVRKRVDTVLPHGAGTIMALEVHDSTTGKVVLRTRGMYSDRPTVVYAALSADGQKLYLRAAPRLPDYIAIFCRS
ncbi:MAG: WD40 repeat domain-containing protein [Polyangiales bacterium]